MSSTLIPRDTLMAGLLAQSAAAPAVKLDDAAWGVQTREDGSIVEADTGAAIVPAKTVAQDAIETADSYLSNAVLPTYSELLAALEVAAATVELYTGNGSLSQPAAWPRTEAGDIDHEAVSKMARALLTRHARTMAGDFRG